MKALFASAFATHGRLDILVNDVGGGTSGHIWEAKVEDWDFIIALNLRSAFLCTREAAAHMRERALGLHRQSELGRARGHAVDRLLHRQSAYSAAKAAHPRLYPRCRARAGRVWRARERRGARADRDRAHRARASARSSSSNTGRSAPRRCAASACPQDIANAVLYLASDEANYITGTTLAVAGGR